MYKLSKISKTEVDVAAHLRILSHGGFEFGFSHITSWDEVAVEIADQVPKDDIHEWESLRRT